MKIVTWNVNSVRARHDRLIAWLKSHRPDVLCLQELKVTDDAFPGEAIREVGYHAVTHGQRTYNGVAILSPHPITDVERGFGDEAEAQDPQARVIAGTVAGVRVISAYFPNGASLDSDKYAYKLAWMKRLRAHLTRRYDAAAPLALCGDFNVAPEDRDVAKPESWKDSVLCHPGVRAALEDVRGFGFVDAFRKHRDEGGLYSWWDYRAFSFPKNDGLRIDHVYATESLAATSTGAEIDRQERKGEKPSDHAPVSVTFDVPLPT